MRFGAVPTRQAAGKIVAHSVRVGEIVLRKGAVIGTDMAERCASAGLSDLVVAAPEAGDIGEDEAARLLARHLTGAGLRADPPFTGRCNLRAAHAGLLLIDRGAIDAVNAVDEAITVATLPAYRPVVAGEMTATVKIIPYAVPGTLLDRACSAAPAAVLSVHPYRLSRVAMISTRLPGLKESTIDKTAKTLARRLAPAGASIAADIRIAHEAAAIAGALVCLASRDVADLTVVFGASAIADRRDVIPAGIEAGGGEVLHLGMPVDPGNLLLLGQFGAMPVLGAPGCARSPRENGFDWILHRLLAGLPVARADIVALGVGGLLTEITSRPQPRAGGDSIDEADSPTEVPAEDGA